MLWGGEREGDGEGYGKGWRGEIWGGGGALWGVRGVWGVGTRPLNV